MQQPKDVWGHCEIELKRQTDLVGLCWKLLNACLVIAEEGDAEMLRIVVGTPGNLQHTKAISQGIKKGVALKSLSMLCQQFPALIICALGFMEPVNMQDS